MLGALVARAANREENFNYSGLFINGESKSILKAREKIKSRVTVLHSVAHV